MKVGSLVKVNEANGPDTRDNIGEVGIVTYVLSDEEVEIEITSQPAAQGRLGVPWIYYKNQLEVVSHE